MQAIRKKKLIKYLLTATYAAICLFVMILLAVQMFAPQKMIKAFGFQFFLISYTGSMEPDLNYNDLICIKKYDFDLLKKGDIITFEAQTSDGKWMTITHQIHSVEIDPSDNRKYIYTKGTAKPQPDRIPVTIDGFDDTNKYIGKYAFKSEFLGHFVAFFRSRMGVSALLINTCCLTMAYFVLSPTTRRLY